LHGRDGNSHRYFVGKPYNMKTYWRSTFDARTTIKQILKKEDVRM
jgi:hypothetical protein